MFSFTKYFFLYCLPLIILNERKLNLKRLILDLHFLLLSIWLNIVGIVIFNMFFLVIRKITFMVWNLNILNSILLNECFFLKFLLISIVPRLYYLHTIERQKLWNFLWLCHTHILLLERLNVKLLFVTHYRLSPNFQFRQTFNITSTFRSLLAYF